MQLQRRDEHWSEEAKTAGQPSITAITPMVLNKRCSFVPAHSCKVYSSVPAIRDAMTTLQLQNAEMSFTPPGTSD